MDMFDLAHKLIHNWDNLCMFYWFRIINLINVLLECQRTHTLNALYAYFINEKNIVCDANDSFKGN